MHHPLQHVLGRRRLLICIFIGVACFYAGRWGNWAVSTRLLLAWNVASISYIIASSAVMLHANPASIRRHAMLVDQSRFVVLVFSILATTASIAAIVMQLATVKDIHGNARLLHLALAGATILTAWVFIHLVFAFHYAHEFYVERASEISLPPNARGGLRFPDSDQPSFSDFVYYSFVIGCASQTADVETTSSVMRRITVLHGVISFFFNTTILALTINIAAGLL